MQEKKEIKRNPELFLGFFYSAQCAYYTNREYINQVLFPTLAVSLNTLANQMD